MSYVNGILTVPEFVATDVAGEFTINGATYNSQSDTLGLGASAIQIGFVLYVQASDTNTFLPIPGRTHRYKITGLTVVNASTVNLTVLWNETTPVEDAPTNGSDCIITQVSENAKYGFPVGADIYATLNPGMTAGMLGTDIVNVTDRIVTSSGVASVNGKTGLVTLAAGTGIYIDATGPTIIIQNTGTNEGTF